MWKVALISLLFQIFSTFGDNFTDFTKSEIRTAVNNSKTNSHDMTEKVNELKVTEFGSFLDDMVDWATSATEYIKGKSMLETVLNPIGGRKLKYKKAEFKFVMKALLLLKVILGLFLPLGIIASKILSWKAVTLSLMAFMLAKILFIKNLLTGKHAFTMTPANFVPPFFIHGRPNDIFWKRQGDTQNTYPWTSS